MSFLTLRLVEIGADYVLRDLVTVAGHPLIVEGLRVLVPLLRPILGLVALDRPFMLIHSHI